MASSILFVRQLPYNLSNDRFYTIFGEYGNIKQIRQGYTEDTQGTAYIVYENIQQAKNALES